MVFIVGSGGGSRNLQIFAGGVKRIEKRNAIRGKKVDETEICR